MEIMEIDGNIYIFKFGLKGLILLSKMPKIDEEENLLYKVWASLLAAQPSITVQETQQLLNKLSSQQLNILHTFIAKQFSLISSLELAELYAKAVGEIGIQPSEFFTMSKEEIDFAYEGYLHRKEIEANLAMTAINCAKAQQAEPIRLTEDKGYSIGTMQERRATFAALGIEVTE